MLLLIAQQHANASQPSVDCVGVDFKDLVLVSKVIKDRAYERLYATINVSNRCAENIQIIGEKRDGKLYVEYGLEGKVAYKQPNDRDWLIFPGPGRDGAPPPTLITIAGRESDVAYILWPVSILVDYPGDGQFKIGLTEVNGGMAWSPSFQLHDGVQKLRIEHVTR